MTPIKGNEHEYNVITSILLSLTYLWVFNNMISVKVLVTEVVSALITPFLGPGYVRKWVLFGIPGLVKEICAHNTPSL